MCQPGGPEEMGVLYPASNPEVRVREIVPEISWPWDTVTSFLMRPLPEDGRCSPGLSSLQFPTRGAVGAVEPDSDLTSPAHINSYLVAMKNRIQSS